MAVATVAVTLAAAVGSPPAPNRPEDVRAVQRLLKAAGADLAEDGICGPRTIDAIRRYQMNFLPLPDGRVDPGGRTLGHLQRRVLRVKGVGLVALPQVGGRGYYCYSAMGSQFGTPDCIATLEQVCAQFRDSHPGVEIGIGDISFAGGGQMPPHNSHRLGTDADLRPLRTDGRRLPVTFRDAAYSRELTRDLAAALLAHRNVKGILFNDAAIAGVRPFNGHDNHLHVKMKA